MGIPLGEEHGGATYFMLETHYDNPARHQNVVDHSGLRIFYTDKLREEQSIIHSTTVLSSCGHAKYGLKNILLLLLNLLLLRLFSAIYHRKFDTGMLLLGSEVNFLHVIPPRQRAFTTLGRCVKECTEQVMSYWGRFGNEKQNYFPLLQSGSGS